MKILIDDFLDKRNVYKYRGSLVVNDLLFYTKRQIRLIHKKGKFLKMFKKFSKNLPEKG